MKAFGLIFLFSFITPLKLLAHGGHELIGNPWWEMWNWDLLILFNLLALSLIYTVGYRRFKSQSTRQIGVRYLLSFQLGIASLLLALISPIDPLSDLLASVHMLQHTLLMMIAAPLLVVAAPGHMALWALPAKAWKRLIRLRQLRRSLISLSRMGKPLTLWIFYSLTLWIWHLPALYEGALKNPWIHDLQHLAFFVASFLFWSALFDPFSRKNLNPAAGIIYLFVASIHSMVLGILMTFSPNAWYETYEKTAPLFGFTALQDQQLAGLVMWMPAGISYVIAAGVLILRLIENSGAGSPPRRRTSPGDQSNSRSQPEHIPRSIGTVTTP